MRIYLFHRTIEGLNPTLYAYTNKSDLAQEFELKRDRIIPSEYRITRKAYAVWVDRFPQLELMYHYFDSVDLRGEYHPVKVIATQKEILELELYGKELIRKELNRINIPARIFKEEYRDAIDYLTDVELGEYLRFGEGYELGMDGLECPFEIADKYKLFRLLYEKPMQWDN